MPDYIQSQVQTEYKKVDTTIRNAVARKRHNTNPYQIILKNYYNYVDIRKLRNIHINSIVSLFGIIRRITDIREELTETKWLCNNCGNTYKTKTAKQTYCPHCSKKGSELIYQKFQDIQLVYIQEEQADNGKQPRMIKCIIRGGMVDMFQAGNHATITGLVTVEVDDKTNLAELTIDVLNAERPDDDYIDLELTDKDIEYIKELSQDKDIFSKLGNSINPAIWGYDEIKVSLILQMFGGVTVESKPRVRGDSHILLCGDPGLAKSQLIRSVSEIVPRCIYTSGKSTSAAGLTVSAVNDELTGHWTLEAGALVLASGSFCVIDELDKMNDSDRSALHEAMESQSISVAKAGINQRFKTQCPLLCASNPKNGRYIEGIPFKDQVNIPPPLLSRFDLIFMLRDIPNKDNDRKVAERVLTVADETLEKGELDRPVSVDMLRKYIIYARQINPRIPQEVVDYIRIKYVDYRTNPEYFTTSRQVEALRRLSQASARVRLSQTVSIDDAKRAISLYEYASNTITLGKGIDSSVFDCSNTKADNDNYSVVYSLMKQNCQNNDTTKNIIELMCNQSGIDIVEFNDIFFRLMDEGIFSIDNGYIIWN